MHTKQKLRTREDNISGGEMGQGTSFCYAISLPHSHHSPLWIPCKLNVRFYIILEQKLILQCLNLNRCKYSMSGFTSSFDVISISAGFFFFTSTVMLMVAFVGLREWADSPFKPSLHMASRLFCLFIVSL